MSPFCLVAKENEEIYPGPTRGQSESRAASAPSPPSPGFTPHPGSSHVQFWCPRELSLGLTEVAVRLETKCSSLLVSELSDLKTAQAACSRKADSSRMSQSEHPKVNNASSLVKCAQMETAALCVQSSLVHLYTRMWRRHIFMHPHMQADLCIENKGTKNDVKGHSPLCLTGNRRDLAHLRTNVLPSVFLTRVLNPPTFIFWDFINIFQVFNCLSVFPHSPNSNEQNWLIHFRFK